MVAGFFAATSETGAREAMMEIEDDHNPRVAPDLRRNYTSLLPVELLAKIFAYLLLEPVDIEGRARWMSKPIALHITCVCRRWKSIAVEYRSFWTHISLSWSAPIVHTYLEFSKPDRVSVHIPNNTVQVSRESAAWNAIRRAQNVSIHASGNPHELSGIASSLARLNSPPIALLSIGGTRSPTMASYLGNRIFRGEPPPTLRAVFLNELDIPAGLALLRAPLTTLDLRDVFFRDIGVFLGVQPLLDALRTLPSLEKLTILPLTWEGVVRVSQTLPPNETPQITLPSLRYIHIQGLSDAINCFLACVTHPLDAELNIELSPDLFRRTFAPIGDVCFALRTHLLRGAPLDLSFDALAISWVDEEPSVPANIFTLMKDPHEDGAQAYLPSTLRLTVPSPYAKHAPVEPLSINKLLSLLPAASGVTAIQYVPGKRIGPTNRTWTQDALALSIVEAPQVWQSGTRPGIPNPQRLVLGQDIYTAHRLADALVARRSLTHDASLSNLTEIVLEGMDLDRDAQATTTLVGTLRKLLANTTGQRAPLRLVVRGCKTTSLRFDSLTNAGRDRNLG